MDLEIKGKKVLITGSSRGIGAAIARQFLIEGADVVITSRGSKQLFNTESSLKKEFGDLRVRAEICDCTNIDSLLELKSNIGKYYNDLDMVISNVGDGESVSDPLPDFNQWKKIWDINFESALHTARTFLPLLEKSQGCLLFVSSIAAMEAFGAPVDYSTAKAAVVALAKNMSRKLSNKVRVNVVAPGNIFFNNGSWDKKIKNDPAVVEQIIRSTVPMNRFGTPEEVADAVVFICSGRAKFITGSVLTIDGGQTVGVM